MLHSSRFSCLCLRMNFLRPITLSLLDGNTKVLTVLVKELLDLLREAKNGPRCPVSRKGQDSVDHLITTFNLSGTTVTHKDGIVRLSGGDKVDAVPSHPLVGPKQIPKTKHI